MKFFDNDSMFGRFFGKCGDIILLNLLFIICSIPIITVGASWSALSYVSIKQLREKDIALTKNFFGAFKENFKKSTIAWVGTLLFILILVTDVRIFAANGLYPFAPAYFLFLSVGCIAFFTLIYLFPTIAVFENTLIRLILQAFFFAAKNIPITLALALILVVPVTMSFTNPVYFWNSLILWLFFGFGFIAYLQSFLYLKVFSPYLPEPKPELEMDEETELYREER